MHSRFRTKGVLLAVLLAVAAIAVLPGSASAKPLPGATKKGFRLFARALGAVTINNIYCGLASDGRVCVDSTNSSTIGGGFWPRGTVDQYVFNSGMQVAGIIGPNGGTWANDTTGGFFFDPKGNTEHGEEVRPIFNITNPDDEKAWPAAACVPAADARDGVPDFNAGLFHPLLQTDISQTDPALPAGCRKSASQGDVWWLSWEGNYSQRAGRKHPLGVAVETRGMGWNFPAGNEDILYFIYTFYNITTVNQSDYEGHGIRSSLASILAQKGRDFHDALAANGVTGVPTTGYDINELYAGFAADMDVSEATANYATVVLPFALGQTYEHSFQGAAGWSFDPSVFGSPFFAGAGFVGVKYLKSPTGPGEINLFSNTVNSSTFAGGVDDPRDVAQLFRYLSGTQSTALGDRPCQYNPTTTKICYVNNAQSGDMRFFQSSTPLTLAPGEGGSIVVAYIFAPPVPSGACPGTACDVKPDNPLLTASVDSMTTGRGVNTIDTIMGYVGFSDANGDSIPQQSEFTVVSGSLLGKSLTAQAVFDAKFLLPFAPASPEFFLIPGDNKVTVMWKPSSSEVAGDPYYTLASAPTVFDPSVGATVNNFLYDPNYRFIDVEGYRVYRGRVDAPNELTLLAQFDYSGTTIKDFTGVVNPNPDCAPEFGILTNCPTTQPAGTGFPVGGNKKDGTQLTEYVEYDLVSDLIQVNQGTGRIELANGTAFITRADTAVTGRGKSGSCGPKSVCGDLENHGVPFVYEDITPRNSFRYFYSVTAFDINSLESGPSSLESPRTTKPVTPVKAASNYTSDGTITSSTLVGRGQVLNTTGPLPTIDPTKGTFSGQFPASNAWSIGPLAFVSQVLADGNGSLSATLDSVVLGSAYSDIPHQYWFTAITGAKFSIALEMPDEVGTRKNSTSFAALSTDSALAERYGGDDQYTLPGQVTLNTVGPDYLGLAGRGCVNGRPGFDTGNGCSYNGARWFDGPSPAQNETYADPIQCNTANFSAVPMPCHNNAGKLTGVTTIFQSQCYQSSPGGGCRQLDGVFAGVWRAADFNVYWGAAGKVDSVIDVTYNVPVPGPGQGWNDTTISATWGILNGSAVIGTQPDGVPNLSIRDFACVKSIRDVAAGGGTFTCPAANPNYKLSDTAIPSPVMFWSGQAYPPSASAVKVNGVDNGFVMYLDGSLFAFELTGGAVPASGTVWSLRKYVGAITGGNGAGGNEGPYTFANPEVWLPLTAIGAEVRANFTVSNKVAASKYADLKKVHTVPDPYYVTNEFEQTTDNKVLKFVNLPEKAVIRIYSASGILVNVLEHNSTTFGGELSWNVRNRNNQVVASGVYFYHIEAIQGDSKSRRVGKMTIVNFAQ